MPRRRQRTSSRDYPRTARLNELLREIIADQVERLDDDRLGIVSVNGVEVDSELTLAKVWVSSFDDDTESLLDALSDHRGAIRRAIGTQARLRRVPDLRFLPDHGVETGSRIEEILHRIAVTDGTVHDDEPVASDGASDEPVASGGASDEPVASGGASDEPVASDDASNETD